MDLETLTMPNADTLRREAIRAGAIDPMTLRFRIVAYDRVSGDRVGVQDENTTFRDAVEKAAGLIQAQEHLHFLVEPIGFIQ
jgi:hypothetical protein